MRQFFPDTGPAIAARYPGRMISKIRNPIKQIGVFRYEIEVPGFGIVKQKALDSFMQNFQSFLGYQSAIAFQNWKPVVTLPEYVCRED